MRGLWQWVSGLFVDAIHICDDGGGSYSEWFTYGTGFGEPV